MESKPIQIKVKHLQNKVYDIEVIPDETILTIKYILESETGIPASDMKIISKGKMCKDHEVIDECGIKDGCSIHMVQSKHFGGNNEKETKTETTTDKKTNEQTQFVPDFLATGGNGLLNQFGFAGSNSRNSTTNTQNNPLNNPFFKQMMQNMMSNPDMMQQMIQNNPMLKNMIDENPELATALKDPSVLQMMMDPQVMDAAMSMMGRMGNNPMGMMQQNTGSFPMPGGGSNTTQQNSGGELQTETTTDNTTTNTNQNQNKNTSTQQQQQTTTQQQQQFNPFMNPFGFGNMNMNPFGGFGGFNNNSGGGFGGGFGGFGGFNNQNQNQNQNPEEKYKNQLEQLNAMGFTNKDVNIEALKACNGNVEAAIERLFSMMGK